MAEALTDTRRWRGTVHACIIKFEAWIIWWEGKAELAASDHHAIPRGVKTLKEYDTDFKSNHFAVWGRSGIHLPKISFPSFNENILNWTSFWEEFEVAAHSQDSLQDVKKLAYLKDAVKDSPAKHVTKGNWWTGGS